MRTIAHVLLALLAVLILLVPLSAHAQCSSVADVPVTDVNFVATCGHPLARIAANEAGALSVWRSSHAGFSMITYWLGGTVLDAEGAARKPAEHIYQYGSISPEVATDGQDYLMAWTAGGEAWIRVIGSSGEERSDAIKVAAGLQPSADLRVVWNGSEYVAATTDAESRAIIVRISPSGRVIETKAIAWDAMVVGASRTGGGEVLVLVRTSTGFATVLGGGPRVIPIPSTASDVSVASNGSGFLAVFRDSGVVAALPLDASGTTQRSPVTIAFAAPQCAVGIVAEGTNYLALWTNDGVQAASLDADGVVLARFRAANGSLASAAGNGSGTIILARAGCGSIASTFLPRRGQSGVSRDVSLVAVGQSAPAIVETAAGTQLFWSENALLTRFISGAGTLGDAKRVTAQGSITGRFVAALAGSSTFVIWSDYPGGQLPATLRAARFDMNGNLVGSTVITNAWFIFGLAASSNGSDVVVTWTQQPQTSTRFEVFAARLSGSGALDGGPTRLSIPTDDMYEVVAGSEGTRSMVAWRDGASILVSVELGSQLEVLARHELAAATTGVVFPVGVAVHEEQSLIVWWSADTDTIIRLHATESSTGADAVLARGGVIRSVKILPRDNAWLLYFAELDGRSNTIVNRSFVRNAAFGEVEPLFCARGGVDYTLRGERIGAVAYSAPDPALEGASRLYFRRSFPPRRRASR